MKKILVAGLLTFAAASTAAAQDMFASMESSSADATTIVIEPISVTADGFIVVYNYHGGQVGEILGMARVRAGANSETRVHLGHPVRQDALAVLFAGDDISDPSRGLDRIEIEAD